MGMCSVYLCGVCSNVWSFLVCLGCIGTLCGGCGDCDAYAVVCVGCEYAESAGVRGCENAGVGDG